MQGSKSGLIFLKFHIRIIKIQNEAKQIRITLSGFLEIWTDHYNFSGFKTLSKTVIATCYKYGR